MKIISVEIQNFLSIGNISQKIYLDKNPITLLLGENLDIGGNIKNGVGKSSLVQAISFAIYGTALTNVKKDNLINAINGKNLLVKLEFEKNNIRYKIERGRKPTFLKFFVDDSVKEEQEDETRGESSKTQKEIIDIFGISYVLFKHIVALHNKTVPFLSLNDKAQREIIEELFGIDALTKKSELLKTKIKETKEKIRDEEIVIKTKKENNARIQHSIVEISEKSKKWVAKNLQQIAEVTESIQELSKIDIDELLGSFKNNQIVDNLIKEQSAVVAAQKITDKNISLLEREFSLKNNHLNSIQNNYCHTCSSVINEAQQTKIKNQINKELDSIAEQIEQLYSSDKKEDIIAIDKKINSLPKKVELIYDNLEEILNHKNLIEGFVFEKNRLECETNPYNEQIQNLQQNALVEIDFQNLNDLNVLREHQEFLYKVLTNKDSFIRKKIIDQNIGLLNLKLNRYLEYLQLPHEVVFLSDLSVQISKKGKDFDFEQLSNGESNRVVLSLSWAFRDVWENLNGSLNLLIIDELIDTGLDTQGVNDAFSVLEKMSYTGTKNVLLISHKDELVGKVSNILIAQKENDFTSFIES